MMRRCGLAFMVLASGLLADTGRAGDDAAVAERLARVREIHGAAGPWAVAGYRMGERALKELSLPKYASSLKVVHRCPARVQYSCVADGLQAATGASPGKLNLRVEEAAAEVMRTVIRDEKSGGQGSAA
jgi:formylmethanofuran dehydrogenase subunit E